MINFAVSWTDSSPWALWYSPASSGWRVCQITSIFAFCVVGSKAQVLHLYVYKWCISIQYFLYFHIYYCITVSIVDGSFIFVVALFLFFGSDHFRDYLPLSRQSTGHWGQLSGPFSKARKGMRRPCDRNTWDERYTCAIRGAWAELEWVYHIDWFQ